MDVMTAVHDKVCVGMITKAHGIKGHVCVHSYCENPSDIFDYQPLTNLAGTQSFKLKSVGTVRGMFVAMVNDISDRNEAETFARTELYINRDQLPEMEEDDIFYVSDLIGLTVCSEESAVLGTIVSVENFGAGDILECKSEEYKTFMVPFTDDAIVSVDMENERVIISAMAESFVNGNEDNNR
jgi:16S rRNA processing protein RimM